MKEVKKGFKTSEFWITLVTVISGMLYLLGIVGSEARDDTSSTGSHAVESIAMIISLAGLGWKYISGRTKLKEKADMEHPVEPKPPVRRRKPATTSKPKPKAKASVSKR